MVCVLLLAPSFSLESMRFEGAADDDDNDDEDDDEDDDQDDDDDDEDDDEGDDASTRSHTKAEKANDHKPIDTKADNSRKRKTH